MDSSFLRMLTFGRSVSPTIRTEFYFDYPLSDCFDDVVSRKNPLDRLISIVSDNIKGKFFKSKFASTINNDDLAREGVVKSSLTSSLSQAIRVLQHDHINSEDSILSGDNSNTICNILEAIFIHGLKDTFINRVSAILSGNIDKVPDPNFWPFLMIFTHKDVISQINHLSQITTDIGRCRAWIRIALNDGLLESYISAMIKDKSSLQYYYGPVAYLKDSEQPDILRKYLEGLGIFSFKLSYNSRVLNNWTATPLMLAGIWAPPLVPEPVITGVDVASYFSEDDSPSTPSRKRKVKPQETLLENTNSPNDFNNDIQNLTLRPDFLSIKSRFLPQDSPCSSLSSCPDLPNPVISSSFEDHIDDQNNSNVRTDNNIDTIEETVVQDLIFEDQNDNFPCPRGNGNSASTPGNSHKTPTPVEAEVVTRGVAEGVPEAETSEDLEKQTPIGNSLANKTGWSSSFDDEQYGRQNSTGIPIKESESFQTLLKNYSPMVGSVIRTPNFSDLMDIMGSRNETAPTCQNVGSFDETDSLEGLEFEIVPRTFSITSGSADPRTQALLDVIGEICNEQGLDAQNFQCRGCSRPIGMIYGKARVCTYDGYSYCFECHENEEEVIPARIIHNWDFKKYKVARHTKLFIHQIEEEPILDIRKINSKLYNHVEELNELQTLRTQLSYLRSYLFTCRESVAEELRKKIWPKEYLYEHIHLYTLSDLLHIPTGALAQTLLKVINFASKHVNECRLCSQKGFICEVCNNTKVIYPFQLELTYRCENCLAVYHNQCMNDKKPCPKCERRKKRQDESDFIWSVDDIEQPSMDAC